MTEYDSSGAWNGGQTQQRKESGRQSAGNCKPAKKTEAPSTGCLYNISLFEYDENIICLIDHQLPK